MISVNLETKTITKNGQFLVYNGQPTELFQIRKEPVSIQEIEDLYYKYKHSVPSETGCDSIYFKALPLTELSDKDLIANNDRQQAKEQLELTILMGCLNKSLIWSDDHKWFWQSENDKDLVILRQWIT